MDDPKKIGFHVRTSSGDELRWTNIEDEAPAHWQTKEMAQNYLHYYCLDGEVVQCEGKLCELPHSTRNDFGIKTAMRGPELPRRPVKAEIAIARQSLRHT